MANCGKIFATGVRIDPRAAHGVITKRILPQEPSPQSLHQ